MHKETHRHTHTYRCPHACPCRTRLSKKYIHIYIFNNKRYLFDRTMLSPSVRRYNGRLAKTTTVSVNYRIHNVVQEIVEVAKPVGSKKHQCSGGYVWSFTPDPSFQCCKRLGCMAHFTSNLDTRIIEARAPFFDGSLTPKERQARLMANRTELKVPGQDGNMVQVCTAAACKIFGVSRSFWYPLNQ